MDEENRKATEELKAKTVNTTQGLTNVSMTAGVHKAHKPHHHRQNERPELPTSVCGHVRHSKRIGTRAVTESGNTGPVALAPEIADWASGLGGYPPITIFTSPELSSG